VRMYAHEGNVIAEFQDSGPGIKEPNRISIRLYDQERGQGYRSRAKHLLRHHQGAWGRHFARTGKWRGGDRSTFAGQRPRRRCGTGRTVPPRKLVIEAACFLVEDEEAVLELSATC